MQNYSKYTAPRVHLLVEERFLSGNLIKKPLWYDAVCMYPPNTRPSNLLHTDKTRFSSALMGAATEDAVKTHPLFNTKMTSSSSSPISPKASNARLEEIEQYCAKMPQKKWYMLRREGASKHNWNRAVLEASRIIAFPEKIEYPEDRLRERFFLEHPLERSRPMFVRESPSVGSGNAPVDSRILNIDDVVRVTRQLMEDQGMGEEQAYQEACQRFYSSRREEQQSLLEQAFSNSSQSENDNVAENVSDSEQEFVEDRVAKAWLDLESRAIEKEAVRSANAPVRK